MPLDITIRVNPTSFLNLTLFSVPILVADRAKQIKTKAVVNEDPTDKLIRELKEENDRLKKSMQTGKINPVDFVDADGDGIDDRGELLNEYLFDDQTNRNIIYHSCRNIIFSGFRIIVWEIKYSCAITNFSYRYNEGQG